MLALATLFSSYCLIHPSSSPTPHYRNIQVFLYPWNLQGFEDLRDNRDFHDYNDLYDLLVLWCPHRHLQSLKSFKTFKITFTRLYKTFEMRLTNWHLLSYPLFPTWLFSFLLFSFRFFPDYLLPHCLPVSLPIVLILFDPFTTNICPAQEFQFNFILTRKGYLLKLKIVPKMRFLMEARNPRLKVYHFLGGNFWWKATQAGKTCGASSQWIRPRIISS